MSERPLLKQFGELTLADFSAHAVWVNCHVIDYDEPWYPDTDEETFRPRVGSMPASPSETMLLVRAAFELADGTHLGGFVTPMFAQDAKGKTSDLGTMQPTMFLPSGVLQQFWGGMCEETQAGRKRLYASLGKSAAQVFPIRFASEPGLTTGVAAGVIPGFCSYAHKGWIRRKRIVKVQQ